jgi:hypothetical protein
LIAVGHQAIAENKALAGFQLDLETHSVPLLAAACQIWRGARSVGSVASDQCNYRNSRSTF